ncbi:thyrotropin-releasing hormone receptor-like protein, partial [Dinothrombium tinctorium]
MVVIVVVKTKSMKTPTNCYLVSLSFADLLVLVAAVPNEIISYYVIADQWIWGRIGCAIFIFLQYLGINASSLSITSFTVERYIAICHPMKAQKMCTVHRAKRIIIAVWIFAFIYCFPWLFLTKVQPIYYKGYSNIETCTFALSRKHYLGYFFADLVLFYVFPLLLSCLLYGLIARVLFTNTHITKNVGISSVCYPKSSLNTKKNSSANDNAKVQAHVKAKKAVEKALEPTFKPYVTLNKVVKMLIVVVAVFATLWLPYRAWLVYNSFAEDRYMELWFLMFCKTMIFVNSAINPILYNALSVKFRRAFKQMFSVNGCKSRNSTSRDRVESRQQKGSNLSHNIRQSNARNTTKSNHSNSRGSKKPEKFQEFHEL